jgi:murein DD-endopeptidase MepM/ murein hydrolase activator NlpD
MAEKSFRKKFIEKIRDKYRLIIYNDTSYQSILTIKLTPLKVFTFVSLFSVFMIFLVIFLVASTQLKEYIPGYPKAEYREMLLQNTLLVDSIKQELAVRDQFFQDIRTVVSGDIPKDAGNKNDMPEKPSKAQFKAYNQDSVFQDKILEEKLNLNSQVKGLVTGKFDAKKGHYGVDLVGPPNSRISAVLGGTVLFAGWTMETGNVIYLLHGSNMTSAYKHNAELLKKTGELVKAGEAIAIIGNSGELSTGPHLHFELWYNGKPVDPEKYIVF